MELKSILLTSLLLLTANSQLPTEQQPLRKEGPTFDLIDELIKAEIIPTVFDPFKPFLQLNVTWTTKASAAVGNTLKPKKLQSTPQIDLLDHLPDFWPTNDNEVPQLTLVLTDPDARSRDNPDWSEMCHWIATEIPLTRTSAGVDGDVKATRKKKFHTIVPYQPPGPPPKTGKHRYVFAALAPSNGTSAKLHLSTPKDRQHWGYGGVRRGLRDWAEENGLELVGANFIYAQHKKQ